jgi:osmotically-inducible protein OsmY
MKTNTREAIDTSRMRWRTTRAWCALLGAACVGAALSGCVALAGGALVGGSMLAVDRRSNCVQVDDQAIELKATTAVGSATGDRGRINITSYNRSVLLTGEVPTEADRKAAESAAGGVAGVAGVVNDLAVMPSASLSAISNDSIITGKVKAAFLDTSQLQVSSIKVVTERGTVYLLGRVTEAEAARAAEVTRGVSGVRKVVKVFEIITPAQLAAMPAPPQPGTPAASGAGK